MKMRTLMTLLVLGFCAAGIGCNKQEQPAEGQPPAAMMPPAPPAAPAPEAPAAPAPAPEAPAAPAPAATPAQQ